MEQVTSGRLMLEVNVVNLDFVMAWPKKSIDFTESENGPVPVVRIFGSTSEGQRACVYVHGVRYSCQKNITQGMNCIDPAHVSLLDTGVPVLVLSS